MVFHDTMQGRILEAAGRRFKHLGFAKTSVAEIARDLQMSPGNLYRYFPGKVDIALAIVEEVRNVRHVELAAIAAQSARAASARLRDLLHHDLAQTFRMMETDRRLFELAEIMKAERPACLRAWLERDRALFEAILRDGIASREFDMADATFAADMLQAATTRFRHPQLWGETKLPALKRELDGVLGLLLVGLAGHQGHARSLAPTAARLTDAA